MLNESLLEATNNGTLEDVTTLVARRADPNAIDYFDVRYFSSSPLDDGLGFEGFDISSHECSKAGLR